MGDASKRYHATSVLGRPTLISGSTDAVINERKELVERTTIDSIATVPQTLVVPSIPLKAAIVDDFHGKILEVISLSFYGIVVHYFKDDEQPEFILDWTSNYEATCKTRNSVSKNGTTRYCACIHRPIADQYDYEWKVRTRITQAQDLIKYQKTNW